jgi:Cu(I)/Ag(I) efflux system membrane fusion protein
MRKRSYAVVLVAVAISVLLLGIWAGRYLNEMPFNRMPASTAAVSTSSPAAPKQLYTCSMHPQVIQDHPGICPICHMELEPLKESPSANAIAPTGKERKILYWTDTMYNPPYIANKPGKSPMGMDLTPVYADDVSAGAAVIIDPVVVQNMGVRIASVVRGPLHTMIRAVGSFTEPEQNHTEINLRVSGWIQKLYANQDGMNVAKGDPLFDLYSPELTAASDELIAARKMAEAGGMGTDSTMRDSADAIVSGARRKLALLGLPDDQIDAIAKLEKSPATITFKSPMSGHVTEKTVVEGSAVKAGERVMRIADRSTMWLQIQVYERDLALVKVGTPVTATVTAAPGATFEGKVDFIYPHLDMMTRTATARVIFPNVDHELREGMYASALIQAVVAEDTLLVPREAIIDSGTRQIVFIAEGDGHFEPRTITVGLSGRSNADAAAEMVQVLTGLNGSETVVTSGQFLLDSESRLQEAIQKHLHPGMDSAPGAAAPATPPMQPATMPGMAGMSGGMRE